MFDIKIDFVFFLQYLLVVCRNFVIY